MHLRAMRPGAFVTLECGLMDEQLTGIPPLLYAPLIAAALWWLFLALGRRALRILRVPLASFSMLEKGCVSALIGIGVIQFLPMTLGAFGSLSVLSLRIATGCLGLLLLPDFICVARRVPAAIRELLSVPRSRWVIAWVVTVGCFLFALLLRTLVEGSLGDDDGYHLTAPKRWLEAGNLGYLPTYTHTNAPMGFEMSYMIALALGNASVAKVLHFYAGLGALLGVFLCARRLGQAYGGLLAVSCLLVENPFFDIPVPMGFAFIDMAVCWAIVAAVLFWLAWNERREPSLLFATALCVGFAASFKFTAIVIGGVWTLLVLAKKLRDSPRASSLLQPIAFGVIALLPVTPWLFRNWVETGNPVYPMFSHLIPTRDFGATHAEFFQRYFLYFNWQFGGEDLTLPQRRLMLIIAAIVVVIVFGFAILRTRRWEYKDLLILAAGIVLPGLAVTGLFFRFYLPATFLTMIVAACLISEWVGRKRLILAACVLIAGLALAKWGSWARHDLPMAFRVGIGMEKPRPDAYLDAWHYINENTPRGARILLGAFYPVFHASSGVAFWVDRSTYTTDAHLQDFFDLADWSRFKDGVRDAGIDFAAIPKAQPTALMPGMADFAAARNEYPFSRRLVTEFGRKLYENERLEIYSISLPR
jgi:hypothetical protein